MHRAWIAAFVFLGLVLGAGCTGMGRFPQFSHSAQVATMPVLAGRDANGQEIRLDAYRGQVVLIDVWKTG